MVITSGDDDDDDDDDKGNKDKSKGELNPFSPPTIASCLL